MAGGAQGNLYFQLPDEEAGTVGQGIDIWYGGSDLCVARRRHEGDTKGQGNVLYLLPVVPLAVGDGNGRGNCDLLQAGDLVQKGQIGVVTDIDRFHGSCFGTDGVFICHGADSLRQ